MAARCSTSPCRPARPPSCERHRRNLGCQRPLPRADHPRPAGRPGCDAGPQRAAGGHLDPLARDAPAGRDGRRTAPDDRRGRHLEPDWTIDQPASTLWYHPHPHGQTAEHVYRGVAGLFLIDDDETDAAGPPAEYGVDDIPLIIQDKQFTDDGDLSMDTSGIPRQLAGRANFGVAGDTILVNGTYDPHLEITRSLVRFRLLNGSNARFYNLGFTDDRSFHLVATDNGLVPGAPVELDRLLIGPGERAEIVVAFDRRRRGRPAQLSSQPGGAGRQIGPNDTWTSSSSGRPIRWRMSALPDSLPDRTRCPMCRATRRRAISRSMATTGSTSRKWT